MNALEIKTKIRKWENNYIRQKDGRLDSCLWNGIVWEEIQKLKQLLLCDEDYIEVHNLKCIENCYNNS